MNISQWISCVSEAYKITEKTFSFHKKKLLLKKLEKSFIDKLIKNEIDKGFFETGVSSILSFGVKNKFQNDIEETKKIITRYFFKKAINEETFGPISRIIKEWFRNSIEENYSLPSGPFINIAKTYWTHKIEVHNLFLEHYDLILSQVLLEVEGNIASVFFPTPGPGVFWVGQRKEMQRKLLKQYAPKIDIDAFLENNPILGTSRGSYF